MANPKKEFPNYVIGLLKSAGGFSVCEFSVNDEKRIKYIDKKEPELLYFALEIARQKLVQQAWSEDDKTKE